MPLNNDAMFEVIPLGRDRDVTRSLSLQLLTARTAFSVHRKHRGNPCMYVLVEAEVLETWRNTLFRELHDAHEEVARTPFFQQMAVLAMLALLCLNARETDHRRIIE
jgi:hypothetical protein